MKRREFIKKSVGAGVVAGTAISVLNNESLFAINKYKSDDLPYDLVAIKGGGPEAMFDKAIASLGGMSKFVRKNQTVVVKPNIGWDSTPERAANTNPNLVGRIVEHCIMAGAKDVYVVDHTCNEWTRCYRNSGIEDAVKKAGGKIVAGNSSGNYHPVEIKGGKVLKNARVHELILESDVFINVPTLKSHGGARLSICMKNLMGIVWNRSWWHANDLQQCIADFSTYIKPDLNVVDAYRVLKRNGPRGVSVNDVVTMKYQVLGTDMVAADAASTKIFGLRPEEVRHITLAHELGSGTKNLDKLKINRITI
ncbi:MAG: DUF362 domain-containing protein [Bacteroidales bacterium]|nr:MAG: DUF362 domain-containing protein [Bacteroidales bacterium]